MMVFDCSALLTCLICITFSEKVSSINPKVVGGFEANNGHFPYQISLKYNGNHRCGGTIVNLRHVVTAGHCIVSDNNKIISSRKLKINVGTISISGKGGQQYSIAKIHLPENYSTNSIITHDIAVLSIKNKFRFNEFVQPLPLPQHEYTAGAACTISGWGKIHPQNNVLPEKLHYAVVKIVDRYTCMNWLHMNLATDMLCAGYIHGGRDSCQGDSGGPLMCNNSLTGVISHGAGCALPGTPGIYTDVHHYNKWISDILKSSSVASGFFTPMLFSIIILHFLYSVALNVL